MPNIGLVPIPDTPVGVVRALVRDTAYVKLSPHVEGFGDYNEFSDVELTAFLLVGAGSPLRAAGQAYATLSANAIAESRNITTDDLRISTEKRAADWLALSKTMFTQADKADEVALSAESDFFGIAQFGGRASSHRWAPAEDCL